MDSQDKSNPSLNILLTHLEWNIKHLEEIQKQDKSDYYRNAALQRFGFTVDSALKCIRAGAKDQKAKCVTTQDCHQFANNMGWLENTKSWESLFQDYEKINGNTLNNIRDSIYQNLEKYTLHIKALHQRLSSQI